MKRRLQLVWLALILTVSAGGYAEVEDFEPYELEAIRSIKAAADWVIEEGIPTYYREGSRESYGKYLWEKWEVRDGPLGLPEIESEDHLAWFWLETIGRVVYQIFNLYRETLPGGIYEFWIVRVGTDYGTADTARCMFYVTRADEVRGSREILLKSDRFIARYEVAPGTYFEFPVDDLEVLWKMEAWRYPESYPDSDLKNLKVGKHWRTGRLTVERGDGEQWAYEEDRDGYLMWLAEVTYAYKQAIKAGGTYSEEEWEELYDGLVRYINRSKWPIKEKDWKRYKRRFDKLERLDKTAAKDRFDAKERLNIEWEDKK